MEATGYSEIGAVLRAAREDRHLSAYEVGRLLHIRARYIEALERGDFRELPGLPYAKGYMQAYAAFLELDKDELMRRFERIDGQLAKRGFYLPKAFHSEKKPQQTTVWGSMAAVLLVYALWHGIFRTEERNISIVEHFEQKIPADMQQYAKQARNPACFRSQDLLYPACYMNMSDMQLEQSFRLVPLQGKPASLMQLWDRQMAEATRKNQSQANKTPVTKTTQPNDNEPVIKSSDLPPG